MERQIEWGFSGIGEELTVKLSQETLEKIDEVLALGNLPFQTRSAFVECSARWALESIARDDELTLLGLIEE